ncbi:hypothetical protein [Blastomonas sp.]|uniref:hypothetical protein n=1 Tax=Blastomonas sp. TaxID=1909299 RepID=UPI00262D2196|nr:hypothetical protein [Blastomonas sp.]MDM7957784.1 hypothetical protein [Blastomonas sp.]
MTVILAMTGGLVSAPASAETLDVAALYPARVRPAADVESLVVERFGGREGRALSFALEGMLAELSIYDQSYFRVVAERSTAPADAVLSGIANAVVENQSVEETRKECVEEDGNGKCLRKEDVKIKCQRRIVTLNPSLRMARIDDGAIVYQRQILQRDQIVVCPDRSANRSVPDTVDALIGNVVAEVRLDIAPVYRSDAIRVLEVRKGLDKDQSGRFRDALKATARNPQGACDIWAALDSEVPGQSSIVFNLALCAEQRGDLDDALRRYREAQALLPRERAINAAFDRINARSAAEADYAAREDRLSGNRP